MDPGDAAQDQVSAHLTYVEGDTMAAGARLAALERELAETRAALRRAEDRERELAVELQHRVRNILAVIRSVFRRSRENGASDEEFAAHFRGRLDTIARYQSDLRDVHTSGVALDEIVRDQLLDVGCVEDARLTITGPSVMLRRKHVETMGLALHELTTNSIKFGALGGQGALAVSWSLAGTPDVPELDFRWRESGVAPMAAAPRARGFGRQLIEEALPYELGAATVFELRPGGLDCSIRFTLPDTAIPAANPHAGDGQPLLPPD